MVAPAVPGTPTGKLAGQNGGPDLNFRKGQPISTVLKGVVDLDLRKDNLGLFVRNAPYGNFPNGFAPNAPLSDSGFDRSSRFSGAAFRMSMCTARRAWTTARPWTGAWAGRC